DQGNSILGKTGSAVTRSRVQKFRANPVVESDAARDFLHVGSHFLGKVGNFVDKGYLGGQKRVGSVLDQFGRSAPGEQNWRTIEIERPIKFAHKLSRARVGGADNDTIGKLEIADGGAFAQELRIGHDGAISVGAGFTDDALDLITGADRDGRLCN